MAIRNTVNLGSCRRDASDIHVRALALHACVVRACASHARVACTCCACPRCACPRCAPSCWACGVLVQRSPTSCDADTTSLVDPGDLTCPFPNLSHIGLLLSCIVLPLCPISCLCCSSGSFLPHFLLVLFLAHYYEILINTVPGVRSTDSP